MGRNGYERKVVDSHGAELKEFTSNHPDRQNAIPGKILKLGLDFDMQKAAQESFLKDGKNGAAVAMNIKTGEILVLYNSPGFNPNDFIPRISPSEWKELLSDPMHPLQNRSIQNRFAPGSTFKVVMALAALQEELGAWNDAAVAARLAGEFAGPQSPAAAAFIGWAAARGAARSDALATVWTRFTKTRPFWSRN